MLNSIELGGNIELSGFKDVDGGSMVILKKVVGNYVRKMNDMTSKFEKLSLNMKVIHEKEKGENGQTTAEGKRQTNRPCDSENEENRAR